MGNVYFSLIGALFFFSQLTVGSFAFAEGLEGSSGADQPQAEIIFPKPTEGRVGDKILILFRNFSKEQLNEYRIYFNKVLAPNHDKPVANSNGTYDVKVEVPRGDVTGPVTVMLPNKKELIAGLFTLLGKEKTENEPDTVTGGKGRGSFSGPAVPTPTPKNPAPTDPTPQFNADMDLPVTKPVFVGGAKYPTTLREPPPPPYTGPPPRKTPTIYGQEIIIGPTTRTFIYVLDISGSMEWDYGQYTDEDGNKAHGNRLDRAKTALLQSLASLEKDDKFTIVAYGADENAPPRVMPWISRWGNKPVYGTTPKYLYFSGRPVEADEKNRAAARAWISKLTPYGGTPTGPAVGLGLVLSSDDKVIILITDGAPNIGIPDESESEENIEAHRAFINASNRKREKIHVFCISPSEPKFKRFGLSVAGDSGGNYTEVR